MQLMKYIEDRWQYLYLYNDVNKLVLNDQVYLEIPSTGIWDFDNRHFFSDITAKL